MDPTRLLRWQWEGYARSHRSRTNLLLHIIVVPLFLGGNMGLLVALVQRSIGLGALSLLCMIVSLALQGRGHRAEEHSPEKLTGPLDAALRIFFEQWITFPRFVLSGGWGRALRNASRPLREFKLTAAPPKKESR